MTDQSTDGTNCRGELERFAIDRALTAAWGTEFWIPAEPDYGFVDYFEAAATRNLGLLSGFEDLAEDASRRGIIPQTDSDQAQLVTDGGTDERRTTQDERRDERPPFVDANAEVAECYFCGQTWEPAAVDGFDLSGEDEYYPKMVPVCPEHAGGCR
jgi:hypothetical protein